MANTPKQSKMNLDPENPVVKLCVRGIALEDTNAALTLFTEAWNMASNDFEKLTAAHYIARLQSNVADKLTWNQTALKHALNINEVSIQVVLPSLYLNIGKCHEEMGNLAAALEYYQAAQHYLPKLPGDGYSNMIHNGVKAGLDRVTSLIQSGNYRATQTQ